jgi:N-acetylglucosamine-6-phosphate deacetylase
MNNATPMKIITGATLVLPQGQQSEGTLVIEGNRIRAITTDPPGSLLLNQENVEIYSGEGCYVTPGLIELHFNGALGCNLGQTTITEVQALLRKLPAYGITSALFTLITAPLTDTLAAIHTLEEVIHYKTSDHCRPLGLHLEGPFINREFRGTHPPQDIRPMDMDELEVLMSPMLKMVTLAPETEAARQAIRFLAQRGIRVSIGHTNATLEDVELAIEQGASSVTHIFNAMRPFHHRVPGIVGAALCDDRLYVQVISDGVHLHPETIKLILRAKRPGHVLLTSDASPLAGMDEGTEGDFFKQHVVIRNHQAINQEGHLAGSSQIIPDCVKNLVRWHLTSFADAVQFATLNPATFLGLDDIGRLEPGCLADVVLWNKQTLEVEATFINGQVVYQKNVAPVSPR